MIQLHDGIFRLGLLNGLELGPQSERFEKQSQETQDMHHICRSGPPIVTNQTTNQIIAQTKAHDIHLTVSDIPSGHLLFLNGYIVIMVVRGSVTMKSFTDVRMNYVSTDMAPLPTTTIIAGQSQYALLFLNIIYILGYKCILLDRWI